MAVTGNVGCQVGLIGAFSLRDAEGVPIAIQGRRTRAMLAYLLLAPGQVATRERLAALFWSERGETQARSSLRQCLLELRGALPKAEEELLVATRETVALSGSRFDCDAVKLQAALGNADWRAASVLIEQAGTARLLEDLELRGEYREWLDIARAQFETAIGKGLAAQLGRAEAEADWAAVKALGSAWLRRDPLSEVAVAALIRAELASGASAAAHRHYQAFKAQLAVDIGVAPGPLVEAAIRGSATLPVSPEPAAAAPPTALVREAGEIVLAVLPFDNLSPDPELAWLCDGVAEEIQRMVARGSDIKVVARSSSFQFRGQDKDVAAIAAALGASHVLDGTVRRSGDRVRINVELVECASLNTQWSDRFEGSLDDVFALQDTIAERVASTLKVALAPDTASVTLDPRAYETFLRARSILAEGDPQFDDSAKRAIPLLEQVVAAAPGHAPAWELLAGSRVAVLRHGHDDLPFEQARDGVLEAARKALAIDSRRSGAWLALATLEPWGAYAEREALLSKALEASPRDPAVLTEMSSFCWNVGRFRDALQHAEQACELNPLMPAARLHAAQMRAYVGDYEASVRMLEGLHAMWPGNAGILMALLNWSVSLGFTAAYHRSVGDIAGFDGWQARDLNAVRLYAEAVLSYDPAIKLARVESYAGVLKRGGTLPLNLVIAVATIGYPELALELAEQASYDHVFDPAGPGHSAYYPGTALGPWSTLVLSPRFVGLCDRLGLCRYWLKSGNWPDCVAWAPYDFKAEVRRVVAG